MNRLLVQILCFSQIIILAYTTEYEINEEIHTADRPYDLSGLLEKSVLRFKKASTTKYNDETVNERLEYPKLRNYLFDPSTNLYQNSTKCFRDLLYTVQNLKNAANPWALQMFDSYGKLESGILQGNVKWFGDYSECVQVQAPPKINSTTGNFHGKYCSVTLSLASANFSLSVTSGVCIPSTCSPEIQVANYKPLHITDHTSSNETKPTFQISDFKCKATKRHLNIPAKAVIALLSLFGALTVLGSSITVFKYFKKRLRKFKEPTLVVDSPEKVHIGDQADSLQDNDSDDELLLQNSTPLSDFLAKCQTFLNCFCIFQNGEKILNTNTNEGELLCIHGIRFLSMSWVILGHTYAFCFAQTKNLLEAVKLVDNFPFQIILQGFYSVDSFFVLSGFLLTYLSMQQFAKKKGGISWPYFYIHRYIRLTPVYMFTLAFSASVFFYLGSGPFWPDGNVDPNCKASWWWNLLYINNFKNMADQCMGWAWYLANDMQFFIISPIFLISLWRLPPIGYSLLVIFWGASFLANFFITYQFDLPCGALGVSNKGLDITEFMAKYMIYFDKIYTKPYTRIGPYLIGILAAYLLFRRKMSGKPKYSWITLLLGWIVASSITLACVYGLYHRELPLITRSIYNACNRTCFAMGLSWVIYVCLIGQGGFVNSILSFKLFIPLSRLTYVAYLIHPMIITGYFSSLKTAFVFSHPTLVCLFVGLLVTTYALALPVTLVFESPVISLEKLRYDKKTFIVVYLSSVVI